MKKKALVTFLVDKICNAATPLQFYCIKNSWDNEDLKELHCLLEKAILILRKLEKENP